MFINLNRNTMEVQVVCGILEKYAPTKATRDICSRVDALRALMDEFMTKQVEPALMEINQLIAEENDKHLAKDPPQES